MTRFDDPQQARFGAIDIAYRTSGDGIPVLLLHPVGLDSLWWQPFATRLSPDYRVIAPDLRGHGLSAPLRAEVELGDFADDAAELLRLLDSPPAHVVGLSMGGMVAQHLAIRYPELVRSLALLGTACGIPDGARPSVAKRGEAARQQGMGAVLESTLERWFTAPALQSPLGECCRVKLAQADAKSWAWCWRAISRLDTVSMLGTIAAPTLVVTGSCDASAPPAAAQLMARHIPHARVEIIDGAPHMGAFEQPDAYLAPVVAFLKRH